MDKPHRRCRRLRGRLLLRFGRASLAVACAVALSATPAIEPPAVAASVANCVDGWRAMRMAPALLTADPMAAASVGGAPAWWVGKTAGKQAVIARWSGRAWRASAWPWSGDTGLSGVAAWSARSAWAVGYSSARAPRPIAARWDGSAWKPIGLPRLTGRAALTDVVATGPGRAVAVGTRLLSGQTKPLALARTSGSWRNVTPPLLAREQGGLVAVALAPDRSVWVAGWRADHDGVRPWIAVRDGSGWREMTPATIDGYSAVLTDVFVHSSNDAWLAGYAERRAGGGYRPVLQRWDGSAWHNVASPFDDESVMLSSVAVGGDGVLAIGGSRLTNEGSSAVLATLAAGEWSRTATRADSRSWVYDMAPLANGTFAALTSDAAEAYASCSGGVITAPGTAGPSAGPDAGAAAPAEHLEEDLLPARAPATAGRLDPALRSLPTVADLVSTDAAVGIAARDVTVPAGLSMSTSTYGALAADFTGDGWTDVFINRHISAPPLLMAGGADGFRATNAGFIFTDRHGCTAADISGDGQLDLFCSVGRRRGSTTGAQELLLNVGDTGGTQAAQQYGILDAAGRGRVAAFVRLGQDPLPALFIGNDPTRIDGLPGFNRFYRNHDGAYFVPAPELGLDTSVGAGCVVAANLDADDDDEILLCTGQASPGSPKGLHLLDFDGLRFRDVTVQRGLAPMSDRDIEVGDFNADGRPDVAQLKGSMLRLSTQRDDGFTTSFSLALSGALAMALGDVNGDGADDVYVRLSRDHLLLVNGGDGTSFSRLPLPAASGSADEVIALDFDRNGLADFLELNGRYTAGPLKLIALYATD